MDFLRKSVATKITLIISLMTILTSLVVGSLFYISGNNIFKSKEVDEIQHVSRHIRFEVNTYYKELLELTDKFPAITEDTPRSEAETTIDHFISFNPHVLGVKIETRRGSPLYGQGKGRLFSEKTKYRTFVNKGKSLEISNLLYSIKRTGKEEEITPVNIIKFHKSGLIFYFILSSEHLFERINQISLGDLLSVVFDLEGKIIYHPNSEKRYSKAKVIQYSIFEEINDDRLKNFVTKGQDFFMTFEEDYRGEANLFYTEKIFVQDKQVFGVLLGLPKSKVMTFKPALNGSNLLIGLIFLVGFSLLGWLFTRYLLSNLNEITEQAKLYTQGEQDIHIEVKSSDEIGILALTFQGMIRQVNERTRVLRKSERRIREARDQAEQALSSKSHLLEDLRRQKSEIERVSKDKDDLLAIVSHDLKNPLAVVETSMDIILEEEGGSLSSMASDLIRRSKSSARIALNLITDLLDLSRLEGGIRLDFERFSVDEMIESVVDSFYLKSKEKNITINMYKEGSYDLIADYGRIIQVLSNIIGNSLKFTPNDGKIDINIREYQTSFSYEGNDKGLEIVVNDNGPGIPVDKLDSIFDKFSQARKKDREIGTGLGLTICKNICELHNGEIFASSQQGKGATFTIKLPRLIYHQKEKEVASSQQTTVMVVNDDEGFRKNARSILAREGYQVLESKNGEEMLKNLETNTVSLLVLDQEMPVKNGIEALMELKEKKYPRVPTILLADSLPEDGGEVIREYVVDMMSPDVEMDELLARVSTILKPDSMTSFEKKIDPTKKTILVVDDEEGIRTLLYENFTFIGYNCLFAKNGVEGLFLIQKYNLDLVISDIRMSEVDGLTLTKVLKKDFPKLPVILMSANVDSLSKNLSHKLGIVKLYPKPFDLDDLNDFVRETIGGAFLNTEREVTRSKKNKKHVKLLPEEDLPIIKKNILLVDDSEDMQTLFKVLLRKEDVVLTVANNGQEALDLFKEESFDTIFMDMNMPVMGGKEAVEKMREFEKDLKRKSTHVVLLTADQYEDDSELKTFGFNSYLQKPLSREKIIKEINDAQ